MRLLSLFLITFLFTLSSCQNETKEQSGMKKELFGKMPDGKEVYLYSISNKAGATMNVINYGAIIQSLTMPDKNGKFQDIVLGYDNLEGYLRNNPYFGAIVGRFGNRIGKGQFELDGKAYQLSVNDGPNHLHGGIAGFDKKYWNLEEITVPNGLGVQATYLSPDGEMGYPGNLTIKINIILTDQNELRFEYEAETDQPTILNPTHHAYFNLTGLMDNLILDHKLTIDADYITPTDSGLIPTGELLPVEGTPMDFRQPKLIGEDINMDYVPLKLAKGYDHNWVLNNYEKDVVRKVATLCDSVSGRVMEVYSDQPGIQFYSGNFLNGTIKGKGGVVYKFRSGLCLETQHFPDSPNKPDFPSVVLRPGEVYKQVTSYKFSVK
ncbi:MAG: galactose mutarotase [Calditrichaceae bacterium]|nr:galactose mutarotase [Calditrichaceae bacterium]MBN2710201.1 galactose mutarotase [Calditrichaceae bacterium]RQV94175.1 MAG: galactose mutarotase [Calditrichota bacterium]